MYLEFGLQITLKMLQYWVVPEKNPHTPDGWDSGNSRWRGVKDPGNPDRRRD